MTKLTKTIAAFLLLAVNAHAADVVLGKSSDLTWSAAGANRVAVFGPSDYLYTVGAGVVQITLYIGAGGDITVPSTILSLPVTTYAAYAFTNKLIKSVVLQDNATALSSYMFLGNTGITNVVINPGLRTANFRCFQNCGNLDVPILPTNCNYIGYQMFAGTKTRTIAIGSGVTTLESDGAYLAAECGSLGSAVIQPATGVKKISNNMLQNCIVLTNLVIDVSAFTNTPSLGQSFYGCAKITNTVESLFTRTNGFPALTTSASAFEGCKLLSGNGMRFIDMVLAGRVHASYRVGSNATDSTSSSYRTFYGCTSLVDWVSITNLYPNFSQ